MLSLDNMGENDMRNVTYISVICLLILSFSVSHADVAGAESEPVGTSVSTGLSWQFAYDDAGRVTKVIDSAGRQTKFRYELDNNKRVLSITKELSDASKVTYKFDRFGRRKSMTDTSGEVHYKYDGFNRLTEVHRDGQTTISYTYDTMDRPKSVSVGKGLTTSYSYDFLGRLAEIDTPAGSISYGYQSGQGTVIRTLPNGIRTVWKYGPDGSLQSISHAAKDNKILAQFTYSYRPDGLISAIKEWGPRGEKILTYEYDKVQRLIAVRDSLRGEVKYRYDKLGNRTELVVNSQSISSKHDWAGRMTTYDGNDCSHDATGNLTSYVGKNGRCTLEHNVVNLLKSASMGNEKVEYSYDGDGYLIARTTRQKKTLFIPDPLADIWRPLLCSDVSGKRILYIWEGNCPLAAVEDEKAKFFLHDHLGSVRCIADEKGNIVKRPSYSPFGVPLQQSNDSSLRPGFTGLFLDPKASLYLTRARGYAPRLGCFLQRDPQHRVPLGLQKDLSAYAYCGADPLNFVDLTGAAPQWVHTAKAFVVNFPKTTWEGVKGVVDFYRPSNIAAGFRGGWELGQPHTGTWADQAGRYGGIRAQRAVQGILAGAVAAEILIPVAYTAGPALVAKTTSLATSTYTKVTAGTSALIAKGLLHGSTSEPFHLPFLSNTIRYAYGNPHLGLGSYGWHVAMSKVHLYADRIWYPLTGSVPHQYLPGLVSAFQNARVTLTDRLSNLGDGFSTMTPSTVGGIYLRGAGEALKDLGPLKGIAVDEKNGRLVLLSEGESKIELPPLRLDDVVIIFRSVYEHGDAPYVSIDPNPEDPEGPIMFVRHGEGTADTYVGWILFEADRVMKSYSLGYDNVTRTKIISKIEGYQNLFDLGFSNFSADKREPIWERFWIVPATVNKHQSKNKQLTLFDIPLKVKTQRMELHEGKLVPAEDDTPSEQAQKFAEWFTKCYDKISGEVNLSPPMENNVNSPVAIYGELCRIALVTAIAETLRDKGVPLPTWMQDYPIRPCHVSPTTPAIVVEATKTETDRVIDGNAIRTLERTQIRRIYGGVNLAAADEDVHVIPSAPQAEALAPIVTEKIAAAPLLSPLTFEKNGQQYQAVALPGNNTRDVGACRLMENDLVVPVGSQIALVRSFHSFFKPKDVLGNTAWTLDLPQLVEQLQPTRRNGDKTKYKITYQLTSPLGTYCETFRDHKHVPEANGELLVPTNPGNILGLGSTQNEKIGYPTKVLFFRNGQRLHFDGEGNLVARMGGPLTVVYRRDGIHRVRRIEGWYGKKLRADIRLDYDKQGRLVSAQSSNADVVKYTYNEAGMLTHVEGPKGVVGYQYKDGLVTAVTQNGQISREFEYNEYGQLLREKRRDEGKISYKITSVPEGVKITASRADKPAIAETARYDVAFRPLSRKFEDGTQIKWQYNNAGVSESTITLPQGEQYVINRSADGRKTTWHLPEGGTYSTEHDKGSRLTTLRQGNRIILQQQWHNDGQLATATYETVAEHPEYSEDGIQTGLFITAREKGPQFSRWLRVKYNDLGRPEKITDYSGSEATIGYDQTGQAATVISKRGGIKIIRDKRGRIEEAQTSWGYNEHNMYDPISGELKQTKLSIGKNEAFIEFHQGRPTKIKQFDDGELNISYYTQGIFRGQVKKIHRSIDLELTYDYNPDNRLVAVNCDTAYKLTYKYDTKGRLVKLAQVPAN